MRISNFHLKSSEENLFFQKKKLEYKKETRKLDPLLYLIFHFHDLKIHRKERKVTFV